jgi:hypothetical protein
VVAGEREQVVSGEPVQEQISTDEVPNSVPQLQTQGVRMRLHNNIIKPKKFTDGTVRYSLKKKGFHVSTKSVEPSHYAEVAKDEKWRDGMDAEFLAL